MSVKQMQNFVMLQVRARWLLYLVSQRFEFCQSVSMKDEFVKWNKKTALTNSVFVHELFEASKVVSWHRYDLVHELEFESGIKIFANTPWHLAVVLVKVVFLLAPCPAAVAIQTFPWFAFPEQRFLLQPVKHNERDFFVHQLSEFFIYLDVLLIFKVRTDLL